MSDTGYTPSKDPLIDLRKIVEATLNDPLVPQGTNSVKSAQVVLAMREWLAAHDAEVRRVEREKCAQIDLRAQDAAAFVLYKHERPESIAESWETVGLPIVLNYRAKAIVVLERYFAAIRGQSEEANR